MLKKLFDDETWTKGRGPVPFQIGLATFGILALELALIRWTSSQIRVFAYFNNLVLIGAFLGMGLGVALGRRRSGLVHLTLPALCLLSIPLAFSEALGIIQISFPDSSVILWGAERFKGAAEFALHLAIFISLFCLIVLTFLFAGSAVGHLFPQGPALRSYSSDLLGSLLGVLAFTVATFLNSSPPAWLLIGGLPFLWLSRRPLGFAALAVVVGLGAYSIKGAVFSAYNRIDVGPYMDGHILRVNRDFHQLMHDLSDRALASQALTRQERLNKKFNKAVYDIPFTLTPERSRALVVGAGTGNDAQAALRNGYKEVYSIDIDGRIIDLGRRMHPERPYSDPRVKTVVNDARAFFEQYDGPPFDVVCYGLVDSHAMFSSMSSLRLDNYLYTEEGIRAAWGHVSENGHLSISFSIYAGDWIADRLYWMIFKATGKEPVMVYHDMHYGAAYLVGKDNNALEFSRLKNFERRWPRNDIELVDTPTDNWPFLYVRPGVFPWGYALVIIAVVIIAAISTPMAFGRKAMTRDFDLTLFLMGAAFLLIETRGVTSLSLLFGSTWIVNASIFAGVLVMVLAANIMVERVKIKNPTPWFILLLLSTIFLWAFDMGTLNNFSMLTRGVLGGLINALPIGFAGVIVSIFLARSRNATASLGSNLLGSVVGGCLEYLSMYIGLKSLVLIALAFYVLALLHFLRGGTKEDDNAPADGEQGPQPDHGT